MAARRKPINPRALKLTLLGSAAVLILSALAMFGHAMNVKHQASSAMKLAEAISKAPAAGTASAAVVATATPVSGAKISVTPTPPSGAASGNSGARGTPIAASNAKPDVNVGARATETGLRIEGAVRVTSNSVAMANPGDAATTSTATSTTQARRGRATVASAMVADIDTSPSRGGRIGTSGGTSQTLGRVGTPAQGAGAALIPGTQGIPPSIAGAARGNEVVVETNDVNSRGREGARGSVGAADRSGNPNSRGGTSGLGGAGGPGSPGAVPGGPAALSDKFLALIKSKPVFGSPPPQNASVQGVLGDSALINGQWLALGASQGNVKLTEIQRDKVIVEVDGERRELPLWPAMPSQPQPSGGGAPPPSSRGRSSAPPSSPPPSGARVSSPGALPDNIPPEIRAQIEAQRAARGGSMPQGSVIIRSGDTIENR